MACRCGSRLFGFRAGSTIPVNLRMADSGEEIPEVKCLSYGFNCFEQGKNFSKLFGIFISSNFSPVHHIDPNTYYNVRHVSPV